MRNEIVCTKTLYKYLHQRLLRVKAIDIPLVIFRHRELDTARGTKEKTDHVLVSLLECKSKLYMAPRSPSARSTDVKERLYIVEYV